ncbi:MAG: glycosyltransferase [Moraxellaceae bacterium]|nr:glycosyltransferase [Psychrobacter sp.]
MIRHTEIVLQLPSYLAEYEAKLRHKIEDDILMYDILALAKDVVLFYFHEGNQTAGAPNIFYDNNVPDGFFTSGTILAHASCQYDNAQAVHPRIYIAIPFSEKEDVPSVSRVPRRTKLPGFKKYVGLAGDKLNQRELFEKFGNKIHDKYGEQDIFEDLIAVEEKRQHVIDDYIANRKDDHQHTQIFYNGLVIKNFSVKQVSEGEKTAVFALHWLDYGGAEKFAIEAMNKAKEMGYKVYCIVDKRGNKAYESKVREIAESIFYIADSLPEEHWSKFYINLFPYLGAHLLHIHHSISAYQNLPKIKALTTWPRVIDSTHIVEHQDGGYPRVSGVFSPYVDFHHTISKELNTYLSGDLNVPKNKIKLGYLINRSDMVDVESLSKTPEFAEKETFNILFIGRFVSQKRPYLFIELVKTLRENKNKNIQFTMVGSGPMESMCKNLINNYGLNAAINLLPPDSDVEGLLVENDLLVISSENEGLTLVAYEAVRNNCLALSCDVGAQREVVADSLIVSRHPRPFITDATSKINKLINDKNFASQCLMEQANKYSELQKRGWEDVLEDLYQF